MPPLTEQFVDLHFPAAGIDLSAAFGRQPNRPMPASGQYARTSATGINVRSYEGADRVRGGSRAGIEKYLPVPVVADWVTQELAVVVVTSASAEV